jgi:hypothetical protein
MTAPATPEDFRTWEDFARPSPAQYLPYFLALTEAQQLARLETWMRDSEQAMRCFIENHRHHIAGLEARALVAAQTPGLAAQLSAGERAVLANVSKNTCDEVECDPENTTAKYVEAVNAILSARTRPDENTLAGLLCDADLSYDHHDQTDDHPCSRCKARAADLLKEGA